MASGEMIAIMQGDGRWHELVQELDIYVADSHLRGIVFSLMRDAYEAGYENGETDATDHIASGT